MLLSIKDFFGKKINEIVNHIFSPVSSQEVLRKERRIIFFLTVCLTLLGLLFIYESSSLYSFKYNGDAAYFLKKQVLFFLISLLFFYAFLFLDLNFIRQKSKLMLAVTVLILVFVFFFGKEAGGARRWVKLAGFNFQPSELLKVFFLIYCADYCSRKRTILLSFKRGIAPLALVLALLSFLLLLQPDLGSVIFWVVWFLIFVYLSGAKPKHLASIIAAGAVIFFFLINFYSYRLRRIIAYFNPFADPRGFGFQLIQSQLAFGKGGLLGVGLGEGKQKLFFLPAAHTDFIFSIIAEELGLVGTLGVLLIFFIIIHKMFKIAGFFKNRFRRGILLGIALIFFLEVFINIGVTCGLLPTKGMSLPFISYGGTNLVVHYLLIGLFFKASNPGSQANQAGKK